jgi:hypothetical protein
MIGKKAATGSDYIAFLVFVGVLIFLFILSVFIITPSIGGKTEYAIKVEMEGTSDNLFLYGYLRQNLENKNIADLIAESHTKKQYEELKQATIEILDKTQENTNFRIYIDNNEEIEECQTKCKGDEREFEAKLPTPKGDIIDFKIIIYENE